MIHRLPVLLVAAALAAGAARGASFDCGKAATAVEKSICADPKLGALDEQIARAYTELLRTLDEPARRHAHDYQVLWLRARPSEDLGPAMTARLAALRDGRRTVNGVALLFLGGPDRPPFVVSPALAGGASYNAWAEGRWKDADDDDRAAERAYARRRLCQSNPPRRPAMAIARSTPTRSRTRSAWSSSRRSSSACRRTPATTSAPHTR
jgi:hypothetical protein